MRRMVGLLLGLVGVVLSVVPAVWSADLPPDACLLPGSDGQPDRVNWRMFGRDLCHTFTNRDSKINAANVAALREVWSFPLADAVHTSPSVVDGVVYVGSWDGNYYALYADTGVLKWKFEVDCQKFVQPQPPRCGGSGSSLGMWPVGGLIGSSATVVNGKVYFGGGRTVYALSADTMDGENLDGTPKPKLLWRKDLCGKPTEGQLNAACPSGGDPTRIRASVAVFDGKVFVAHTANGAPGFRGGFDALSADTGAILARFEVENDLSDGKLVNRGCGGVWSSPAIDTVNRLVFFGTADCGFDATPPFHEALIALHTDDAKLLELAWYYRPRPSDACDLDFGAPPNVVDFPGDANRYVGIGGKDGTYYMLKTVPDLSANSGNYPQNRLYPEDQVVWKARVVHGGMSGGFIGGTAFDGTHVFGSTGFGELGRGDTCHPEDPHDSVIQEPSIHAFNARPSLMDTLLGALPPPPDPLLDRRRIAWQQAAGMAFSAPSVSNGVVFQGSFSGPGIRAYEATTGALLAILPVVAQNHSEPALVGDMLFVGSGGSYVNVNSAVRAFKLPLPVP